MKDGGGAGGRGGLPPSQEKTSHPMRARQRWSIESMFSVPFLDNLGRSALTKSIFNVPFLKVSGTEEISGRTSLEKRTHAKNKNLGAPRPALGACEEARRHPHTVRSGALPSTPWPPPSSSSCPPPPTLRGRPGNCHDVGGERNGRTMEESLGLLGGSAGFKGFPKPGGRAKIMRNANIPTTVQC